MIEHTCCFHRFLKYAATISPATSNSLPRPLSDSFMPLTSFYEDKRFQNEIKKTKIRLAKSDSFKGHYVESSD